MVDFKHFFNEEYQIALKNAVYTQIERENQDADFELSVRDRVDAVIHDKHLEASFGRKVFFDPAALYSIDIVFTFSLFFKNTDLVEEAKSVDWKDALTEAGNPYLTDVISRASYLIATLTSSYGQQPLVTPPVLLRQ